MLFRGGLLEALLALAEPDVLGVVDDRSASGEGVSITDRLSPSKSSMIAESLMLAKSFLCTRNEISKAIDAGIFGLKKNVMP